MDKLFGVWFVDDGLAEVTTYLVDQKGNLIIEGITAATDLSLVPAGCGDPKERVCWLGEEVTWREDGFEEGSYQETDYFEIEGEPYGQGFFTRDEAKARLVTQTFEIAWNLSKA